MNVGRYLFPVVVMVCVTSEVEVVGWRVDAGELLSVAVHAAQRHHRRDEAERVLADPS
jgi:hypothetical protein